MMKHTGIAVLEGRWFDDRNTSVRGVFDVIADLHCKNPHAYTYEMFCDDKALANVVGRACRRPEIEYLYIACHGTDPEDGPFGLVGSDGVRISRTKVRNALTAIHEPNGTLNGVFFGSCFFGTGENAQFLLDGTAAGRKQITWCAGYTKPIHWVQSTVLDMYFFSVLMETRGKDPLSKIYKTVKKIDSHMGGLVRKLGFQVYWRDEDGTDPMIKY